MTARPAALAAALLPLAAPATNAVVGSAELARAEAAVGTPYSWGTFPAVGYCGLTHGNVVKWWQTILWADGLLSATGDQQVDGVFGQNTKAATMKWQQQHSLGTSQVDGCAGVNT